METNLGLACIDLGAAFVVWMGFATGFEMEFVGGREEGGGSLLGDADGDG